MARRSRMSTIDTPPKRSRLAARANPYWHGIGGSRQGVSLGYRKPALGAGTWTAKIVLAGARREARIGIADDEGAPARALTYAAAVAAALDWARNQTTTLAARATGRPDAAEMTVQDAIDAYKIERRARTKQSGRDVEWRLSKHVRDDAALAKTTLGKLGAADLLSWRRRLPAALAPATVNRIIADLRAALNAAAEVHRRHLPPSLPGEIRAGLKALPGTKLARKQVLPEADVRRIVEAAYRVDPDGDFGRLVLVAAATGARFSQVVRITVAGVQREAERIIVPPAAKGRAGAPKQMIPVPVGKDVLELLAPALNGRMGHEPLLKRWFHVKTGPRTWERDRHAAWKHPAEAARLWKACVSKAGLPPGTVMYALRHSSIVRGLLANLPVRLVAVLHDTSVAMIEAHYSEHIMDVAQEVARRAVTPLAPLEPTPLRAA
jgi:hypothetical protein